jgi:hypothetical protein
MQFMAVIHDSLAQRNSNVCIRKMINGSGSGPSELPQVIGVVSRSFNALLSVSSHVLCAT